MPTAGRRPCRQFACVMLVDVLQGLATIRAYGAGDRFRAAFLRELDLNGSWWYAYISTARW